MATSPSSPRSATSATISEPARSTPVLTDTEVLVVGGGTAGVAAAVAAARAGADVTLVERGTYLGGLATGGLVILLLTLDDGAGQQVVGGLCQEVTDRLERRGAAYAPPPDHWGSPDPALVAHYDRCGLVWGRAPHVVRYSVAYDAEEMKGVLEDLCREAGVRLLYGALGCEPVVGDGGRVRAVTFQGKEGRFAVRAQAVVDTTGDGDLFTAAGCAHEREQVAPWLWFTVGGVRDADAARGAGARFIDMVGEGRALFPWNAAGGIRHIDPTSSEDLAFAATECRRRVLEEVARLRAEVPGFERAHLCHVADQLDITESRRLVGRYVLSRDDLDRRFDDVVAVTGHWTMYSAMYHIPYRSLLARELTNLLVAGRHISVDHRTHHATKEIPACFATGEAAGTAAAMAAASGGVAADVDVPELQRRLTDAGAILWPADPPPRPARDLRPSRIQPTG